MIKELAYRKGFYVARQYLPDFFVLSADTIVLLNGKVVGKPKSKKESEEIIRELNGSTREVCTGVAIIQNNKKSVFCNTACVKIKKLPENILK